MKKIFTTLTTIVLCSFFVSAQSYLTPSEGFNAIDILSDNDTFSSFDVYGNLLYANDGDTIRCFNMETGLEISKYGKPEGYNAWPSFVTISPDGTEIWAGFTNSGNTDDRIYSINMETGIWELEALMPGNYDLDFLNGKALVSGLNSEDWNDPTSIFVLDTEGTNNHQKVIEIGGNSAGLATDNEGNIYYSTSFLGATANAVYRWSSADISPIISNPEAVPLTLTEATKLTDIPCGAYDCEVDEVGNVMFNFNDFSSDKVLAVWNQTIGDGYNFDTLAIATDGTDWLTMVKSCGNILEPVDDNGVYVLSWGRPVAKVMANKPPTIIEPLGIISAYESDSSLKINLNNHFTNPDDKEVFYGIVSNSFSNVASASINEAILTIDFLEAGQTTILVKATSNGQSATERLIVGVYPEISGNYTITDFEDLTLADESYWNGDDGSGNFVSGLAKFDNIQSEWSWEGWTYSNISDVVTPGFTNQYSAITGSGFDTLASNGKNYGVAYVSSDWETNETIPLPLTFSDNSAHHVKGFYVTNSTYVALSMEQGDDFTKKFGGETGDDPDYLKLSVWGLKDGVETEVVDFYLADYRFDDNTKDYIVKTWQWVELSSLGKIDTLLFNLSSTDVGDCGINTPTYFNIDNLYIVPDVPPVVINPIADIEVPENSADTIISLSDVFSDADDDIITKSVKSNSNSDIVTAIILGDELTLSYVAGANGVAEIVIEGVSNGKSVTDLFTVTIIPVSGIQNLSIADFIVYPNPSNGVFRIKTDSNENMEVSIFSINGILIYKNTNYQNTELIDISRQAKGNYFVKIKTSQGTHSKLIIVN
ncbi:MAG: DUF4465 domain-containing protein [Bacteroidales bacterium]|nr:DUF4465 domain-containing protein [Bacteroidales bacterium]